MRIPGLLVVLTLSVVSCSPSRTTPAPISQTDAESVFAFERAIEQAQVRKDMAFLDSATASTLRFTHGGATNIQTKEQWLRGVSASTFFRRDVEDQHVEFHGDVAITTGRIRIERQYRDPAGAKYTIAYVRVYRCRGGRCQLLSHYTTASTLLANSVRPPA